MRKIEEGYFTVEAAMVMPIVLGIIVTVIYLAFFQYNRCLLEQDVGILALRGAAMQTEDNEERIWKLEEEAAGLYGKKYIAMEWQKIELRQKKGILYVRQSGQMKLPFCREFLLETNFENHVLVPTFFVRSYRKLMGE